MPNINQAEIKKKDLMTDYGCCGIRRKGFGLGRGMGKGLSRNKDPFTFGVDKERHRIGGLDRFFPIIRFSNRSQQRRKPPKTQKKMYTENRQSQKKHDENLTTHGGNVLQFNEIKQKRNERANTNQSVAIALADKCMGCGLCAAICSEHAITIANGSDVIIDSERCVACGFCVDQCPNEAISIYTLIQPEEYIID